MKNYDESVKKKSQPKLALYLESSLQDFNHC